MYRAGSNKALLLGLLSCCSLPSIASAQRSASLPAPSSPPAATAGPAQASTGIQEIVVTAQKRSQSINNVGLTIQAASSDQLQQRGITSVADLNKLVPGFTATQSQYSTPVFTLRGVGLYDASFGSAPAVAVYTDQVPRNFPVMSDALDLDLERVEVLKGPQGTLFGQSATGGAVNYIMAKPTDHLTAGIDASYERFNKIDLSGFVSGPITDTLEFRLALRAISGGAWQYSLSRPNDNNGDQRKFEGRLSLAWRPTDRLKVDLTATGVRDRSDVQAPQYVKGVLNTYSAASLAAANASPATANPYGVVDNPLYAGITTPGSPNYDSSYVGRQNTVVGRLNGSDPAAAADARAMLGTPDASGNARAAEWTPGLLRPSNNYYYQGIGRVDYDLADDVTLSSITAYARKKLEYNVDDDATTADIVDIQFFGHVTTFNEEVHLSGKTGHLNWIVGGTFDNSKAVQNSILALGAYSANQPIPSIPPITTGENDFSSKLKTYAGFANADYAITSKLSVIAGVRYTANKQSANYCYNDPAFDTVQAEAAVFSATQNALTGENLPPIQPGQCFVLGDGLHGTTLNHATLSPFVAKQSQSNVSFRAGVNYKLDQGTLLYATVSQGYKAGVLSNIGASNTSQYEPAVQEKVIAYEAGFKMPLFERRLHLNGAAFYYDYTNKQVRAKVLDSVFGLLDKMVNVPKSYVWGLEGDLQAEPFRGLNFNGGVTFLQSDVTSDFSKTAEGAVVYNAEQYQGNFKGSSLPFTPKLSATADIQYDWSIGQLKTFVGGTVLYQGSSNATFENDVLKAPTYRLPGYATVDLRAGFGSDNGAWQVMIFGRNVLNKYYVTSISTYLDTVFRTTGMPATYGVSLKLRFG